MAKKIIADENKSYNKDESKGKQVVDILEKWIIENNSKIEQLGYLCIFFDNLEDGEFKELTKIDFASYYKLMGYSDLQNKTAEAIINLISGLILNKEKKKPINALRYENYLKGIEYFKMAFELQDLELQYHERNNNYYDKEDHLNNAKVNFKLAVEYANEHFKQFEKEFKQHSNGDASIKDTFKEKIKLLVEIYNIQGFSAELKDNPLIGKIVKAINESDFTLDNDSRLMDKINQYNEEQLKKDDVEDLPF